MTITDFLEARIATEELEAMTAKAEFAHGGFGCYGPARVLAECKAKRAIIKLAEDVEGMDYQISSEWGGPNDGTADDILGALAAVYADHPDYRQEWKA